MQPKRQIKELFQGVLSFGNVVVLKFYILRIPTIDCASSRHVDVITLILFSLNLSFLIIVAYCFQPRHLPVIEPSLFPRLISYCAVDGYLCALLWRLYEVSQDVVKQPLCAREKVVVRSHESRVHCISGHFQAWQQQQQKLLTPSPNSCNSNSYVTDNNNSNSYWLPVLNAATATAMWLTTTTVTATDSQS